MQTRTATCRCGQLRATTQGEPLRVSACHCFDCQKRSGSAFATQARWRNADVTLTGITSVWETTTDSGRTITNQFCPTCGSTLAFTISGWEGVTAIPVGNFADPSFPPPKFSVWEHRKHGWAIVSGQDVDRSASFKSVPPTFQDNTP